jgi:hypothetical protein
MVGQKLHQAIRTRLAYLDQCLTWRGQANRSDLISKFGISQAQAAIDFREYLERCQAPLPVYDPTLKTYVASDGHRGLVDPGAVPPMLEVIADGAGDRFDRLPATSRHCPALVMRHLYLAMYRGLRIEVDYTSMSSGEGVSQWIAPAKIGFDGERLHFRAWSYQHQEWRDYLPVRVSQESSFATEPLTDPLPHDDKWETRVQIELRPKLNLSRAQKDAVRLEYGIEGDGFAIETSEAMAFYLDRRWGLDQPGARLERTRDADV